MPKLHVQPERGLHTRSCPPRVCFPRVNLYTWQRISLVNEVTSAALNIQHTKKVAQYSQRRQENCLCVYFSFDNSFHNIQSSARKMFEKQARPQPRLRDSWVDQRSDVNAHWSVCGTLVCRVYLGSECSDDKWKVKAASWLVWLLERVQALVVLSRCRVTDQMTFVCAQADDVQGWKSYVTVLSPDYIWKSLVLAFDSNSSNLISFLIERFKCNRPELVLFVSVLAAAAVMDNAVFHFLLFALKNLNKLNKQSDLKGEHSFALFNFCFLLCL